MNESVKIVVAWHNADQLAKFLTAWHITLDDPRVHFQQDKDKSGCAKTKNWGIQAVIDGGADVIIIADDDCLPHFGAFCSDDYLGEFIEDHLAALEPVPVRRFRDVTVPQSRGTPFLAENKIITMPVAASYGFWQNVGDYDAPSQLVYGATKPMQFNREPIYGDYFAGSGMNMAFRKEWWPICQFIDVSRYDDIWQSWIWQKIAYSRGYCFNMNGPNVYHSRQSNVWQNLRDETKYAEVNETLWRTIAMHPSTDYSELRKLLPV